MQSVRELESVRVTGGVMSTFVKFEARSFLIPKLQ